MDLMIRIAKGGRLSLGRRLSAARRRSRNVVVGRFSRNIIMLSKSLVI